MRTARSAGGQATRGRLQGASLPHARAPRGAPAPPACCCARQLSGAATSTSGRCAPARRPRSRALQVSAALFEPPAFQPSKLSVEFLPGADARGPAPPCARRYTLTHNDLTGALRLSIGAGFNARQVQGFYTRVLRDEVVAEWRFGGGGAAAAAAAGLAAAQEQQQQQPRPGERERERRREAAGGGSSSGGGGGGGGPGTQRPSLHIFCHVSGEERWLAPPQLRNFIFRREMTLVLDTFLFADRELLRAHPWLRAADVLVHFQSAVADLDVVEHWGTLGDRRSWQRMPRGVGARLRLLLAGFPDGRRLQRQPCGGLLLREAGGGARRWGAEQAAALGRGGALRARSSGYVGESGGGGGGGRGGGGGSADEPGALAAAPAAAGAAAADERAPRLEAAVPTAAAAAADAEATGPGPTPAPARAVAVAMSSFDLAAPHGSGGGSGGGGSGSSAGAGAASSGGLPGAPALASAPVAVRAGGRPLAFEPARAALAGARRRQA